MSRLRPLWERPPAVGAFPMGTGKGTSLPWKAPTALSPQAGGTQKLRCQGCARTLQVIVPTSRWKICPGAGAGKGEPAGANVIFLCCKPGILDTVTSDVILPLRIKQSGVTYCSNFDASAPKFVPVGAYPCFCIRACLPQGSLEARLQPSRSPAEEHLGKEGGFHGETKRAA
jgi:hypothetical protein